MFLSVLRYRVDIARINPNEKELKDYAEIFTLDLDNNLELFNFNSKISNEEKLFILEPFDIITIRPDPYFEKQKKLL